MNYYCYITNLMHVASAITPRNKYGYYVKAKPYSKYTKKHQDKVWNAYGKKDIKDLQKMNRYFNEL